LVALFGPIRDFPRIPFGLREPAPDDLGAIARSIVDSNRYMTLATADEHGMPWASPVWYAPEEYRELFWGLEARGQALA